MGVLKQGLSPPRLSPGPHLRGIQHLEHSQALRTCLTTSAQACPIFYLFIFLDLLEGRDRGEGETEIFDPLVHSPDNHNSQGLAEEAVSRGSMCHTHYELRAQGHLLLAPPAPPVPGPSASPGQTPPHEGPGGCAASAEASSWLQVQPVACLNSIPHGSLLHPVRNCAEVHKVAPATSGGTHGVARRARVCWWADEREGHTQSAEPNKAEARQIRCRPCPHPTSKTQSQRRW